jgi:biotin transport system substrate-specific component
MTALTAMQLRLQAAALNLVLPLAATLLLTASAKISVPFYPVPMTLQTFVVIGLGFVLGSRRAAVAMLLYLAEGAAGLPVFSGTPEKGIGLAYMLGPTGGYLLGYLPAVLLAGWTVSRGWAVNGLAASLSALLAGAIVYLPGLLWLGAVIGFDKPVLQYGLYPFILGDVTKAILAALLFIAGRGAIKGRAGR